MLLRIHNQIRVLLWYFILWYFINYDMFKNILTLNRNYETLNRLVIFKKNNNYLSKLFLVDWSLLWI